MTRDRARMKAIRARMAASGEPYSAAAHKLDFVGVDDPALTDEVVARAHTTLAAPRADYGGPSGRPLRTNNHQKPPDDPVSEPLVLLRKLRDVTDARPVGHETARGTPCRVVAVRAGSLELTVWLDDEHVRRIQCRPKVKVENGVPCRQLL